MLALPKSPLPASILPAPSSLLRALTRDQRADYRHDPNGSGIRDIVGVLGISTDTVLNEHKKRVVAASCEPPTLVLLHPDEVGAIMRRADEAEVNAMWLFVGSKKEQRWLWHAIDPGTGKVLTYVFGRRQEEGFLKLKGLLEPLV